MATLIKTVRSKIDLELILDLHAYDSSSRYVRVLVWLVISMVACMLIINLVMS